MALARVTADAKPFAGIADADPVAKPAPSTAARANPLIFNIATEALLSMSRHPGRRFPYRRCSVAEGCG